MQGRDRTSTSVDALNIMSVSKWGMYGRIVDTRTGSFWRSCWSSCSLSVEYFGVLDQSSNRPRMSLQHFRLTPGCLRMPCSVKCRAERSSMRLVRAQPPGRPSRLHRKPEFQRAVLSLQAEFFRVPQARAGAVAFSVKPTFGKTTTVNQYSAIVRTTLRN